MIGKKRKVLIIHPNDEYDLRITKAIEICLSFEELDVHFTTPNDSYDLLKEMPEKELYEILILPNHKGGILEKIYPYFKNLKWVQAIGTGIDKLLQCPGFKEDNNIIFTNLRSVSNVLISEFAILGCLYFSKRIPMYLDLANKKEWISQDFFDIISLERKTALIVGLGSIGQEIAKKLKLAFNMKVIGIKRNINKEKIEYIDQIYQLDKLEELCSEADYVFNSLPTLNDIEKLYTEKIFKKMKRNAIFINTGRGKIVDEIALCKALKENWILGAALDVVEKEPLEKNHPFYQDAYIKNKVLLTCHSMDKGPQYEEMMGQLLKENLINYLSGKKLNGIIQKELGY